MHISFILPLSLSLVSGALAQAPRPPAISINVGGNVAGQQQQGVGPTPIAQQPGQQQPGLAGGPAPAGPAPAAITIRPAGAGNPGQAGVGVPQGQVPQGQVPQGQVPQGQVPQGQVPQGQVPQGQVPQGQVPQGQVPQGQVPALGQVSGAVVPVWVVKVGSPTNDLVFSPNQFNARPGEFIQFQFYSRNHSVVSSTFEQPCVPNTNTAPQRSFFSGFMPTDQQGQITYTIPVRDTDPIWFYCSQARHCQDGMVGVINPPQNGQQTLQQYQQNAQRATDNISPNAPPPGVAGGGQVGTQTGPGIAQTTRSTGIIVRRASWELVGAALVAWAIL